MLVLQGLKLTKTVEESLHEIKEIMGPKNVASSFFPKQRVKLHNGSVNIEYLNPTVYHQFVNKTHKIHNSHVTFTPHNLEGTLLPSKEQQKQFGFCDINSALVNTIEAIQNAPSNHKKKARVEDFNELKIELKTELKRELKAELTTDFKEKWPSKGKTSSSPQTPTLKGSIPTYKKS
jgi:ribosomal protein S18